MSTISVACPWIDCNCPVDTICTRNRDNAACVPASCINGKCQATGECACPPWPATDREYMESPPLVPVSVTDIIAGLPVERQDRIHARTRELLAEVAPPRTIIAFTGLAGSGKSTAAAHLVKHRGFTRVRFAGPLKAMLAALGCTPDEIDGSKKEQPCDLLCGKTPRQAMQWLGTEFGRDMIGPDLWIRAWNAALAKVPAGVPVVVDDARFPNEVAAVTAAGGLLVRIVRPGAGAAAAGHSSEAHALPAARTLHNTISVQNLRCQVDVMLADLSHHLRQHEAPKTSLRVT